MAEWKSSSSPIPGCGRGSRTISISPPTNSMSLWPLAGECSKSRATISLRRRKRRFASTLPAKCSSRNLPTPGAFVTRWSVPGSGMRTASPPTCTAAGTATISCVSSPWISGPATCSRCRPPGGQAASAAMNNPVRELLRRPVVVAPMSAGPSTTDLVIAASTAGALGFLAAGYKSAAAMRAEMDTVEASGTGPYGVNVFVPGAPAPDPEAVRGYVASLAAEAGVLGVQPGEPRWTDDDWDAKIAALLDHPPPVVSFTFGCPDPGVIAALRTAGSATWVTVTEPGEAALATARGADGLCVQAASAGAHRGTFSDGPRDTPDHPLPRLLRDVAEVTGLPLVAAGGLPGRHHPPGGRGC